MDASTESLRMARYFHKNGDLIKAEKQYQELLDLESGQAETLHALGIIAYQTGRYDRAAEFIQAAIRINPEVPQFHYNTGLIRIAQNQRDQALASFERAARIKMDYADAYFNMALIHKGMGRIEEAIGNLNLTIRFDPQNGDAYYNLGNIYKFLNQAETAMLHYQTAIRIDPNHKEALNNLGLVLKEGGLVDEAVSLYRRAIQLHPGFAEAHWNLSIALLLNGRLKEGFHEYEWRFLKPNREGTYPYRFKIPQWNGKPFSGKRLLVHSEQGLGDTIQFIRYLPMVKRLGGTVLFETFHPLTNLLKNFPGIDELLELSPNREYVETCDFYIPLLSLPRVFNTVMENIPSSVPYVFSEPRKKEYWRSRLEKGNFKVGLVWSGKIKTNDNRPCPIRHFLPLLELKGLSLYGLQKGNAVSELTELPPHITITNLGDEFEDFSDTAAVIDSLDLLISIDTSVAHLAGAMGKPVWTLLPFAPDWRWLLNHEGNPWYPSMKLFRQPAPGDWESVICRVTGELGRLMRNADNNNRSSHSGMEVKNIKEAY